MTSTAVAADGGRVSPTRRASAALTLATVAVYADIYITQPILPVLSREFRVRPATAGLSISIVVLMIAIVSIPYGSLSDAVGRKPVMVTTLFLLGVPTLLCAVAPSFPVLVVFRGLQGALIPGVTAIAVAYLGDAYPVEELGPKVGGWIAASVAGGLIGRVVSGLLADWTNWRAPFLLFGVLTIAAAAGLARELPRAPSRPARLALAGREITQHFSNRRLIGAFVIGGAVFFCFIGIFTYLPYYLTSPPFRLSTAFVSSIYLVYVAGIFTSIASGRLSRRFGGRRVMAVGLVIAALAVTGTLIRFVPAIIGSLVILCVGMFTVQSTAPAFVNSNARTGKGAAGALYVGFYYVGATFGSILPGLAWQAWGWPGVVSSCVTALAVGLLADGVLCV
ncbi:MAG: MFS transporter [Acidobacteria bacterium]|nr:MFS transporter [Acidobacteriota bacterium]